MARQHGRIDTNQPQIVDALRKAGATVAITSDLGHGFSDLVVGYHGTNYLIECKHEENELTDDEATFFYNWEGAIAIARTPEEALHVIGAI